MTAKKTPAAKPAPAEQKPVPQVPFVPGMTIRNGMTPEQIKAEYVRVTGQEPA